MVYLQDVAEVTLVRPPLMGGRTRAHVVVEDWRGRRWASSVELGLRWDGQRQAAVVQSVIDNLKVEVARMAAEEGGEA